MSYLYQQYDGGNYWLQYYQNGEKKAVSLKTKDKKLAQAKQKQIDYDLTYNKSQIVSTASKVHEVYKKYLIHTKARVKPHTLANYKSYLDRTLANAENLSDINEKYISSIIDRMAGNLSNDTANHALKYTKQFMNYCVRSGYIPSNPINNVKGYRVDVNAPVFLSKEQMNTILEISKEENIYPVVAVALYAGLRKSEIQRLKPSDIYNNQITVQKSKSGKFRSIPINKNLNKVLAKYPPPFKFTNFKRVWKRIKRKAKIDQSFRFHDLRHTFASQLVMNGVDIYTVSKLLGHSDVRVTQIYAHLAHEHLAEAVGKLDK